MTQKSSPFDDLRDLVSQVQLNGSIDIASSGKKADAPMGVDQFLHWLRLCQGEPAPKLNEVHICVLASSYNEETKHLALSFIADASRGRVTVNALCKDRGIGLRVLEMAPSIPHKLGGDWAEKDCMAAVAFGMEAAAAGGDLLGLSDCAPGSEVPAIDIIKNININHNVMQDGKEETLREDPLLILQKLGGREIAGMVGALIAARTCRLPVLVEGWSGLAALHILAAMNFDAIGHVQVASYSDEAQKLAALAIGKTPIMGQSVEMGAGCGIALAVSAMIPLLQIPTT
jgi:nicotinate-nucleotide--dimethylbenzimidazole phosphoribosyltransferase